MIHNDNRFTDATYTTTTARTRVSRFKRTLLDGALRDGVPEPEEFEADIFLKGAVHQVYAETGAGKSWVALWAVARALKRGQVVLYLDMENGKRTITERLQELGVGSADAHLHYYYFPGADMSPDATAEYTALLQEIRPDLIVFDSWIGFLAACGLDENSPTHIALWENAYVQPAKERACTVLILDHAPHNANRSRGATRKKDLVDVQWALTQTRPFGRERVGHLTLTRKKDRESWLPERVGFSVGGTEDGFVFERSDNTLANDNSDLTPSARTALDALDTFEVAGARYGEWQEVSGLSDSTFRAARKLLLDLGLVRQEGNRYYSINRDDTATTVDASGHEPQHSTAAALGAAVPAVDDSNESIAPAGGEAPKFDVLVDESGDLIKCSHGLLGGCISCMLKAAGLDDRA